MTKFIEAIKRGGNRNFTIPYNNFLEELAIALQTKCDFFSPIGRVPRVYLLNERRGKLAAVWLTKEVYICKYYNMNIKQWEEVSIERGDNYQPNALDFLIKICKSNILKNGCCMEGEIETPEKINII